MVESIQKFSIQIGENEVEIETGRLARSADASVVLRCGDTVLLATAVSSEKPRTGIDFFPLLIDYEERLSSIGKIPGGFLKKEGRPSDKAILTCRLIDRPIRPLFPKGYRNDVQIVVSLVSSDQKVQPDTLAILAASTALSLSKAPFGGPVGAVRVSEVDGQLIVNPTYEQSNASDLDIVIAGTEDSVIMVEAGCKFVKEEKILQAVELAQVEIKKQVLAQKDFVVQCGVEKEEFVPEFDTSEIKALAEEVATDKVYEAYHQFDRATRKQLISEAKEALTAKIEELPEDHSIKTLIAKSTGLNFVGEEFKALEKKIMREMILTDEVRADGRKTDEIRPISCEVGFLPRTHGSAIFTRGNTQVLSVATLAGPGLIQKLDGVDPQTTKRYMHSYSFPGYSVGEVKPMRGAGRREIGHGALAERAVLPSLPAEDSFPYAIRVTSDILESNGSTSMASTCGSSLALMDAGVPVSSTIAGIAMGLIQEGDRNAILADIQGIEDFLGDMDFKITGNREGITALQMDMKIKGIAFETLKQSIVNAREGRLFILDKMAEALTKPRTEMSEWAPSIKTLKIAPDSIGGVIGPGGKTIRAIIEETGADIDIQDDGTVNITCSNPEGSRRAIATIKQLTLKVEAGMVLKGKVVRTLPIGAFVAIAPGKDGLVHISKLADRRVENVEDVLKLGDQIVVKVMAVDDRGRINLTLKDVTDEERENCLNSAD